MLLTCKLTKFKIMPSFPVLTEWLSKAGTLGQCPSYLVLVPTCPAASATQRHIVLFPGSPLVRQESQPACPRGIPRSRQAAVGMQNQTLELFTYLGLDSLCYKKRNPNQISLIQFNSIQFNKLLLCLYVRHGTNACGSSVNQRDPCPRKPGISKDTK